MTRASAKDIVLPILGKWYHTHIFCAVSGGVGGYRAEGAMIGHRGVQEIYAPWFAPAGLNRGAIPNVITVDLTAIEVRMMREVGVPQEMLNDEPNDR